MLYTIDSKIRSPLSDVAAPFYRMACPSRWSRWSRPSRSNICQVYRVVLGLLTAKCRIYPAHEEYCVRQLPDISGDICLYYIGTWRQEYFLSLAYSAYIIKKVWFWPRKPMAYGLFFMAVKGLIVKVNRVDRRNTQVDRNRRLDQCSSLLCLTLQGAA